MRRSRFLPIFLTIVFVIVLFARLRREMREPVKTTTASPSTATTSSPPPLQSPAETMTLEPATKKTTGTTNRGAPASTGPAQPKDGQPPKPVHRVSPSPNASAPPHQSAISRVLSPIVKALTPSKPPPPVPTTPPPQTSAQSQGSSLKQPEHETPKDPNSDTTPPQLIAIEFMPRQVHDGEEATVAITAIDDLSGIRGISGTMSSPTGKALQGFATQREGDSNRYIGRVVIAKDAEAGLWRVSFLNMSDNASNSVTLSFAQGTVPQSAVLNVVSSNSDSTPPTLKNIWVEKRAVRGGEKDAIFIEATDDKSGVNLVSAVFQSPTKLARVGAGCQRTEGDVWRCDLNVPTCIDCGDWQLEQVTLQDKANNLATYLADNTLVQPVKISNSGDACDNTPPVLQSVTLDSRDVDVSRGATTVVVTVIATDDNCGVAGVSGQFIGPGTGSGGFFPMQQTGDPNTFMGRIQLDAHAARGTWRINSIQLNDKGHNLRVYYTSDPLLAGAVFQVR